MDRRFFIRAHLAVGRHHRPRTPWCPHGLQLSRGKVFLTDHMHTRSWINHKLSFLQLLCWRSQEYPFVHGKVECRLVFFFELVCVFRKIPRLASGTSLLSFSLFVGPILEFESVGTSLMLRFDLHFPSDGPLLSRILEWRSVDLLNRALWIEFKTFCIGVSPKLFCSLRCECIRALWHTTQLWDNVHDSHSAFVIAFSSFWEVALFELFLLLFINLLMRKQTRVSWLATRYFFLKLALGRIYSRGVRVQVPFK